MRYRKKPVVIEAVQFVDEPTEIVGSEPEWYRVARTIDHGEVGSITYKDGTLRVFTLEGEMRAERGDWIIRGLKGEVYPCKPDLFAASYDPA